MVRLGLPNHGGTEYSELTWLGAWWSHDSHHSIPSIFFLYMSVHNILCEGLDGWRKETESMCICRKSPTSLLIIRFLSFSHWENCCCFFLRKLLKEDDHAFEIDKQGCKIAGHPRTTVQRYLCNNSERYSWIARVAVTGALWEDYPVIDMSLSRHDGDQYDSSHPAHFNRRVFNSMEPVCVVIFHCIIFSAILSSRKTLSKKILWNYWF